ncbi:MAG: hypothetical protein PHQ40_11840 [Anaerolineaceae bacterium]|nr:hypothetical protein [Anaerolineaceae bacterium]
MTPSLLTTIKLVIVGSLLAGCAKELQLTQPVNPTQDNSPSALVTIDQVTPTPDLNATKIAQQATTGAEQTHILPPFRIISKEQAVASTKILYQCAQLPVYKSVTEAEVEPQIISISQNGKTANETINICKLGEYGIYILSRENANGQSQRMINKKIQIRVNKGENNIKTIEYFYKDSQGQEVSLINYDGMSNEIRITTLVGIEISSNEINDSTAKTNGR